MSIHIRVTGKVQGVNYRSSAKEKADELGLNGFVRNDPDGAVSIEVAGDDMNLNTFVAWCKKGPPHAQVMTFVIEEHPEKGYVGFHILR